MIMNKAHVVLLFSLVTLVVGCCAKSTLRPINVDFYGDLATEDTQLAAILSLDVYHGPLDSLTYDAYIGYLAKHELPSAAGLVQTVRKADSRYFFARGDSLLIVLYYKDAGQIVGDNSATSRIDTVIYTTKAGKVQTVEEVARLMRF